MYWKMKATPCGYSARAVHRHHAKSGRDPRNKSVGDRHAGDGNHAITAYGDRSSGAQTEPSLAHNKVFEVATLQLFVQPGRQ